MWKTPCKDSKQHPIKMNLTLKWSCYHNFSFTNFSLLCRMQKVTWEVRRCVLSHPAGFFCFRIFLACSRHRPGLSNINIPSLFTRFQHTHTQTTFSSSSVNPISLCNLYELPLTFWQGIWLSSDKLRSTHFTEKAREQRRVNVGKLFVHWFPSLTPTVCCQLLTTARDSYQQTHIGKKSHLCDIFGSW